jgi:putative transposase
MGIYRWTYNQCVAFYKQSGQLMKCPDKQTLRDAFVKVDTLEKNGKQWALDMNYNSRHKAIDDFITAFKINKKVYAEKLAKEKEKLAKRGLKGKELKQRACSNVKFFAMKFKSKKKKIVESFYVQHRDWNAKNGGLKWLRDIKTKCSHLPEVKFDTRIIKDSIGRFYLIMLKPLEPMRIKTEDTYQNIIALDPGVRTFLTGFDTEGNGIKFGKYGINAIHRKLLRADSIQSTMNQKTNGTTFDYNHKRRQNMRKAMRRVFCKVKNQVKDAHHKISKFLCQNYDAILLPDYKSSEMVQTGKRKIQGETVRKMLTWSYYKFKQIIQAKAKRYDCLIVPCTEHYTSKTCSECGFIDNNLRGAKTYHCKQCASIMDRDLNAAKNILLKFIIEQTTERARFTPCVALPEADEVSIL